MNLYPKTKKGQEKFNKIIKSSIETIAKLGYSNASVGEITRNAGVSYGLFYLYFKDKDDLLEELVKKYNHEMRKYIHDSINGIEGRINIEVFVPLLNGLRKIHICSRFFWRQRYTDLKLTNGITGCLEIIMRSISRML